MWKREGQINLQQDGQTIGQTDDGEGIHRRQPTLHPEQKSNINFVKRLAKALLSLLCRSNGCLSLLIFSDFSVSVEMYTSYVGGI